MALSRRLCGLVGKREEENNNIQQPLFIALPCIINLYSIESAVTADLCQRYEKYPTLHLEALSSSRRVKGVLVDSS